MDYATCDVTFARLSVTSCGYVGLWIVGILGGLFLALSIWFLRFFRSVSTLAAEDSAENVPVEQISAALSARASNFVLSKNCEATNGSQFVPLVVATGSQSATHEGDLEQQLHPASRTIM